MLGLSNCPSCGFENPQSAQFCSGCGEPLITRCRMCGGDNALIAQFCRHCGAELAAVTVGMPFNRVRLWREVFEEIGWSRWREFKAKDWAAVQARQLPVDIDDREEPWIFASRLDGSSVTASFKPLSILLYQRDSRNLGDFRFQLTDGFSMNRHEAGLLIATRNRIAVLSTKSDKGYVWRYGDLSSHKYFEGPGPAGLIVKHSDGESMLVSFKLPRVGLIDVMASLTAPDSFSKALTYDGMLSKRADEVGFRELLDLFFTEAIAESK